MTVADGTTDPGDVATALAVADAGLAAVAARLADATPVEGRLHADGDPLTPTRLEGAADAAMTDAGGDPTGATSVESTGPLRPGHPVTVALAPRVDGVPGPLSRTFVVDGSGGWERRAAVAVGMAHDAVRRVAEPGLPAHRVVDEAVAELGAYGLGTDGSVARPLGATTLDFSADDPLAAGDLFVLDPIAVDPDPDADRGRVRIGGPYVVTESGCRSPFETPTSLSPSAYR